MREKGLLVHIDWSTVEFLEESKLQTGSKRNFLVIVDPSLLHQSFLLGPVCFIALQSALHISAPYLIPREQWKIRKRTSQLSASYDHATWQLPRENPRLVRESAWIYVVRVGQFVLKNWKIVPYHRCARIPRDMVSVPDYGSWWTL